MNLQASFLFIFLSFSCNQNISQQIPIRSIPQNPRPNLEIESEIKVLASRVRSMDFNKVSSNLEEQGKTKLNKKLEELKKSLNKTISQIKNNYTPSELNKLRASYYESKQIFSFIVKNYNI